MSKIFPVLATGLVALVIAACGGGPAEGAPPAGAPAAAPAANLTASAVIVLDELPT